MLSELILRQQNLPDTIEDISKFVLIGREKLTSVRAEIRAIDKLELAEEVREQKREEAQMLGEALLDAEVRIGELFKQIPKYSGKRTDLKPKDTNVPKSKEEIIGELGFNKKQVQRFETLASNKDLVEQVKVEARENEDIPTRSRVIQLVKEKTKEQQYIEQEFKKIENETFIKNRHNDALFKILTLEIIEENVELWISGMTLSSRELLDSDLDDAIGKLKQIKEIYKNYKKLKVVG